MLKIISFYLLVSITSLTAQTNFSPYHTKVLKTDGKYLYIQDSQNFSIGSSGIVMHSFDETHKTIVATVKVVEKKDGQAILKHTKFKALEQSALPSYNITPISGDKVTLNYLYKRATAVVPDAQTLQFVTSKFSDIEWVHPDIFASKLAVDYSPIPTKEDFLAECTQNSYALVFFAIQDNGYFVDCNSFKILAKTKLPQSSTKEAPMVPFYTRLKEIKGRMFGLMGGDGITNYDNYYKKMLGLK